MTSLVLGGQLYRGNLRPLLRDQSPHMSGLQGMEPVKPGPKYMGSKS